MFENRSLRLDLAALGLLGIVVFLTVSLVTYTPADPIPAPLPPFNLVYTPDVAVYPQNAYIRNACGICGAIVADATLQGIGAGAYYLVFSLLVLDVAILRRKSLDYPVVRALGWSASLVGVSTLLSMFGGGLFGGAVIGPGGYLGALVRSILEIHFATTGSVILMCSLTLAGLLLATDYAMFRFGMIAVGMVASSALGLRSRLKLGVESLATSSIGEAVGSMASSRSGKKGGAIRLQDDLMPAQAAKGATKFADETDDEEELAAAAIVAKGKSTGKLSVARIDAEESPAGPTPPRESKSAEPSLRVKNSENRKGEPQTSEHEEVRQKLNEASGEISADDYELPSLELLLPGDDFNYDAQETEVRRKAKILEKTFQDFGFQVKVVEIETGPVIAQYEVELEAGLRLSKITGLAEDLAIALRVPSVRIVAPIPGKNTVGIEVPNEQRQVVRLREVIEESSAKIKKMKIPLFLGKDVSGKSLVADLSTLPHLLIAGRTGTGKSVCLNAIISSILMTRRPDEVRMLMIDPKMVELSGYGRLPHLMHPVVTDMRKAEAILAWAVEKMEERYALLARAGVRHLTSYNQLGEDELMDRLQPENDEERKSIPLHLPFIVIVADEMADLMMTSGKEVEQHIIRLAQKSRAVGIHLILATQKPTVDVITGLIKSNLPARIAFQVASRTDSRVVLDEMGADKLLGNGDMLFLWPGTSTLLRGQGTYLSDEEINSVVDCVSTGEQNFVNELVNMKVKTAGEEDEKPGQLKKRDDLYESAVDLVVREGRGSVSLLQRALGIGYGRAARLIDYMAEDGIVGNYAGSQAREVMLTIDQWEAMQAGGAVEDEAPTAGRGKGKGASSPPSESSAKRRSNVITPTPWKDESSNDSDGEDENASVRDAWDDDADAEESMRDENDDAFDDDQGYEEKTA